MCGICGFWSGEDSDAQALQERVRKMTVCIRHRGPDSNGVWADHTAGLALGHARLSILDLSPAGHQPMVSAEGRYVLCYNGEVYNHLDLRGELEAAGVHFFGHSDTETLLAAFDEWGVHSTLTRCNGMFALALWDRRERKLTLARDRFGKKPLYYGWCGGTLVFGSELKALRAHPACHPELDRDALSLYFRYNYIPCPHTVYQGIFKLAPGTVLELPVPQPGGFSPWPHQGASWSAEEPAAVAPRVYWSATKVMLEGRAEPFDGSRDEALEELDRLLKSAVAGRMLSDVPLGAFLSGGVDSSLVVALMKQVTDSPVRTFTIGNTDRLYNEAEHARAVAQHLGTEHTEVTVTPREALAVVPLLPVMYDEPFADYSQIPTYLVSQLARRSVTVALSGDGGDELFGGYRRYFQAASYWRRLEMVPMAARRTVAGGLRRLAESGVADWLGRRAPWLLPASFKSGSVADSMRKAAIVIGSSSVRDYYGQLTAFCRAPLELVLGAREARTFFTHSLLDESGLTPARQMMLWDMLTYLPDDIMAKVDRASMAVALEARAPLLDYRAAEFAATLPVEFLIRGGKGKCLLRELLYRYVPAELIDRPKMGFSVPLGGWLRGELKDWARGLIEPERLRREGFLNPELVERLWQSHQGGNDRKGELWAVLMFQAWMETQTV